MSTVPEEMSQTQRKSATPSLFEVLGRMTSKPVTRGSSMYKTFLAAFAALLYMIVMGMVVAYPTQATVDMNKSGSRFHDVITFDEISWIASLPTLFSALGTCLSGYTTHKLGRKSVLILASIPYQLSWLLIVYAENMMYIFCGRALAGFCFGICSVAVPAYIMEIATTETRGFLLSCYQTAFTIGILLVTALGYVLRWSWLAVSGAIVLSLGACLLVVMPESPQWLFREGRRSEAAQGLRFLRGKNADLQSELECTTNTEKKLTINEFLHPSFYKPAAIAILLMLFNQLSGITAIISYTVIIFEEAKTSFDPQLSAVIVAAIQVIATIISSILMDMAGRRRLYLTSGTCVAVSLFTLGVYSILLEKRYDLSSADWIPLLSLIVYIVAFSLGFGTLPVVMASEMVYTYMRSTVLALTIVSGSIFGFIVAKTFGQMERVIGAYGVYWTYAAFTLLGTVFGWFFLPETKGRSISDINKSISGR